MSIHLRNLFEFCLCLFFSVQPLFAQTKAKTSCQSFYKKNIIKKYKTDPKMSLKKILRDDVLVSKLTDQDFDRFAKYSYDVKYSYFLKFAVAVDESGRLGDIHFFDTNKFPYHAQFLIDSFFPKMSTTEIDKITLYQNGRKFLLGTILKKNNDMDPNKASEFHVDWINEGVFPAASAVQSMKHLSASLSGFNDVKLIVPRKSTEDYKKQSELFKQAGIALNFSDLLNTPLEVYSANWAVGRLKILNPIELTQALEARSISPNDILILDEAPRELPQVAGVIVKSPTTPSSHLALLSQMYQIPFAYDREVASKYSFLNGKLVYLLAEGIIDGLPQTLSIQPIKSGDEILLSGLKLRPRLGRPALNDSKNQITPVNKLKQEDASAYGSKSIGLGLIQSVLPENSAELALGLPIYYYKKFLSEARVSGSEITLSDFIKQKQIQLEKASAFEAGAILKSIRDTIMLTPIPASIIAPIEQALVQYFPDKPERLKFRSSSNVEDLKGFNGAGLYDSKGARFGDSESISKAVKTVWSSVFNERAYMARKQFGIEELYVGMGILIQKSFKGELANGVAILKLNSEKDFVAEITGFPGEDLEVTAAPLGVVPETMVVQKPYSPEDPMRVELKTKSTEVSEGRTLLAEDEYRDMTNMMRKILNAWPKNQNPEDGLDFEWKVVLENGRRKIYFKQGRPVPSRQGVAEKNMIVLGGSYSMELAQPENPEGLQVYHLPKRLLLEFKTLTLAEIEKSSGAGLIKSIKTETNQGQSDLQILSSSIVLENQPTGYPAGSRKLVIQIVAKDSILGEIRFGSEFSFKLDEKGNTLIPILNPDSQKYNIDLDAGSWPHLIAPSTRFQADYFKPDSSQFKAVPEESSFTSADGSIEFKFNEDDLILSGGYQKTVFKNVKLATIKSKSGNFTVDSKGLIYAPAHHNFSWSYVIDMNHASGSKDQIQKAKDQFGRFIVIAKETDIEVNFYKETTSTKPRFKLINKLKIK